MRAGERKDSANNWAVHNQGEGRRAGVCEKETYSMKHTRTAQEVKKNRSKS